MKLEGRNENPCQPLLRLPEELGLCSVGNRAPAWISKLSNAMGLTSPEAGVRRVREKKAD